MGSKKNTKKWLGILTISIVLIGLICIIIYFKPWQQSFLQFEFGFEPYGESTNQITNLNFIGKQNEISVYDFTLVYDSKYWEIYQRDVPVRYYLQHAPSRDRQLFSGNDLSFNSATPQALGTAANTATSPTYTTLISKEDFSEKDFKTTFISFGGTLANQVGLYNRFGINSLTISLVGNSGEVNALSHTFPRVGIGVTGSGPETNIPRMNVVINPSVVNDKVNVYVNGIKTKEIHYSGKYKIKIMTTSTCGTICDVFVTMESPSYKQQFGCTKEPGEQYYVTIFNEGDIVNINKLTRFKKFCLQESPLKIYSNIGSTTNTEVLGKLVENEEYVVPDGQIWSIEYIGDLGTFRTECETSQIYNTNEDICLARTVVTLICPKGTNFDFEKGYCTIETEPIIYNPSSIETHQTLEIGNQFRFTHILQEETITPNSINIGENNFVSNGIIYVGQELRNVHYPEDVSNWFVKFSFNGQTFEGKLNDKFNLNNFLKVKITDLGGFRDDDTMTVEDFKVEYTFDFLPDFLTTTYEENKITILNDYQSFDGGIILTKTNNIGTTIIETIEKRLKVGNTIFEVDTTNILELKIRPFVIIQTPIYEYRFDSKDALIVDLVKEKLIITLKEDLTEQGRLISELNISLESKINLVKSLTSEIDKQITLISQIETNLAEKILITKTLSSQIDEQSLIIINLTSNVDEQIVIMQSLNLRINEQADMVNQLTTSLQYKAELVSQLQVTNEEQAELISAMKLSFSDQAEIIDALDKAIEDEAIIISNLNLNIKEQGILISNLKLTNQEQAELINALNLNTLEQAELITELKLNVNEEMDLVIKLKDTIEEQQLLIDELKKYNGEKPEINWKLIIILLIISIMVIVTIILFVKRKKM